MTLIVGMYYENKKGALIASDSQATRESTFLPTEKIINLEHIVISACGVRVLRDELVEDFRTLIINNLIAVKKDDEEITEREIKDVVQEAQTVLFNKYVKKKKVIEEEEMPQGIIGVYIDGPKINRILTHYVEAIINFRAIGIGYEETETMLNEVYREDISKKQAIDLSVYCISKISKRYSGVDGNTQIALIEEDGCTTLNYDEEGKFDFYKFSNTKKRMEKISEQQKDSLNILLYGNKEEKKNLVKILNKHKSKK